MVAIAEANSDSTFYKNIHAYKDTHTLSRDSERKDTSLSKAHFNSCRDQRFLTRDVGLEKNDHLGMMHTSDHRRSVWYKN